MTLEQMTAGYPKLAAKVLVNKMRASQSEEEIDLIMGILKDRNLDANGATLRGEPTVVEIGPETEEEAAEAEAEANILDKDPANLTAKELKLYEKAKKQVDKDAKKKADKEMKDSLKAELDADLSVEAKATAKAEKQAARIAKRDAKNAEALESRIAKAQEASPFGAPLLGKRVAFKRFKTAEIIYGKVVGLVLDKRVNMMLLRIQGEDGNTYHKVDTSRDLFLVGENDENGVPTLIDRELPEDIKTKTVFGAAEIAKREAEKQEKLEAKRESQSTLSPYGAPLLGKRVGFKSFFNGVPTYGKAVGLVLDKRVNKVLVRIAGEGGKIYHKVDVSSELFEADENGGLIERELPVPEVKVKKAKLAEDLPEVPATEPQEVVEEQVAPVSEEDAKLM